MIQWLTNVLRLLGIIRRFWAFCCVKTYTFDNHMSIALWCDITISRSWAVNNTAINIKAHQPLALSPTRIGYTRSKDPIFIC